MGLTPTIEVELFICSASVTQTKFALIKPTEACPTTRISSSPVRLSGPGAVGQCHRCKEL